MKYRKKPIVIEAVQHFADMGNHTAVIPQWLIAACMDGTIVARGNDTFIKTLEGEMRVSDGDWIIRGVKGELYPCKPDIFAATYEPACQSESVPTAGSDVGRCASCVYWQPCPTRVKGCDPEKICGMSKSAGYGLHGQDGTAIITPPHFGCINWKHQNEKGQP